VGIRGYLLDYIMRRWTESVMKNKESILSIDIFRKLVSFDASLLLRPGRGSCFDGVAAMFSGVW